MKKNTKKGTQNKLKNTEPIKMHFVPTWLKIFIFGFTTGFAFQFVPGIENILSETHFEKRIPESAAIQNPRLPWAVPILEREGYAIAYDGRAKTALWVYEELTQSSCSGESNREECKFIQDPDIPQILQADLTDYQGSGFDRGHLAPAGNHRTSDTAMQQTFYLSNISPQIPQFNREKWKVLENHVRNLTETYSLVRVVTGPLYVAQDANDGKKYVTYEVIGENDVAVPTHFFKVITVGEGIFSRQWAYILPNEPIEDSIPLEAFQTTVEKVERISGILFRK